jgi:hypothetical protein
MEPSYKARLRLVLQVLPDLRGQRFGHRQQSLGIIRPEYIELAIQELEHVADDRDVAQPQLIQSKGFGAGAPATRAAGLRVKDLSFASEPGSMFRR